MNTTHEELLETCRQYLIDNPEKVAKYLKNKRSLDTKNTDWRKRIFYRDNYTCTKCKSKKQIQAHHIKSWNDYPDLRYNLSNGITLCVKCHRKTNNYGRKCCN